MTTGLPLRGQEIRLLILEPADEDFHHLSYNLVLTAIDHAPPYEALSYAWEKSLARSS